MQPTSPEEAKYEPFAGQLASLLEDILALGLAYHHKLKQIESAALRCSEDDRARVACYVGAIESMKSAKIQEARLLKNEDDELLRSVSDISKAWRAHSNEEIRMRGARLKKLM